MRTFRRATGQFSEQPHYTLEEIERTCQRELAEVDLLPSSPQAIRIERFIEKRFKVTPEYEDLGQGVLGLTVFGKNGVEKVIVSRDLDNEGTVTAERRIRTTLAHEAGHGLLHAHLFILADQPSLLPREKGAPKIMCRDVADAPSQKRYRGQWHEFQANRAIGGLLLPRALVLQVAKPHLEEVGPLGVTRLPDDKRQELVRELADVFNVNGIVASIRLDEMFEKEGAAQLLL